MSPGYPFPGSPLGPLALMGAPLFPLKEMISPREGPGGREGGGPREPWASPSPLGPPWALDSLLGLPEIISFKGKRGAPMRARGPRGEPGKGYSGLPGCPLALPWVPLILMGVPFFSFKEMVRCNPKKDSTGIQEEPGRMVLASTPRVFSLPWPPAGDQGRPGGEGQNSRSRFLLDTFFALKGHDLW